MMLLSRMDAMDAKWTKRTINGQELGRARGQREGDQPCQVCMCLVLQGNLVRPTRFELVTSCSGGKQLLRVIYNLGRQNGR